ncbi:MULTISPECIES: TyeA family type III secretion system gatekeeper subunit [Pseudomonas]|uniref:TyeA family type III secretion system gatekeeper subunit n=1 Tax=Pseudomonas wuhanensis TaxID=2954098 RepID=A0ABY9GLA4_9PSED|nr:MULTISPECIES: TyeA family type III secretion system gatekeeper subunit [unclassified Pseudomonas]WLI10703.1 TyeA family type III secretion system gatekeeper subunit [Pseudomonas sp. FP603]WLI16519.1 TyeA family type III secretion system gatekeeper subunit [Pseudomonas sp. FP607]
MLRNNLLGKQPSLEDLLALVDGEPAMAMAALQTAAQQANAEGHPAEHAALSVWARELGIKHGGTRRSDISALRPSTNSGANRRRRIDTRHLYGDATVMDSVKGLIELLMGGQEKSEHFQLKLQQMQSTIKYDLAAMAPTASQKQIRPIVHACNVVRHVAVLLDGCKKILKRMSGKNPLGITEPVNFLQSLLRLSADGLQIKETQSLARVIGGEHLKHQLAFLNALRPMVQELPLVLWRDLDKRRLALNNLRALMTQLTEQEQIQNLGRIAP